MTLFTNLPAQEGALEQALQRLEALVPDKARVVELRFYGGLSIEETAEVMEISPASVKRHWQAARVWLFDALGAERSGAGSGESGP